MREEIATIAAQRAKLLGLLATFDEATWSAPTSCAPWDVRDVTAHLVDGELALGPLYRTEVTELPYLDPNDGISRWSALPGPAVAAALWQHGGATQRVLDAIKEEAWHSPVKAFGCRTIGQLVRLHLFELAMHGYDIATAAGVQPHWNDCVGFLTEFVVRAAPKTLARLNVPPDGALAVRAGNKSWTIDGRAGSWTLTTEDAPATLALDAIAMIEAVTGRRSPHDVMETAIIEGDEEVARRIFSGWRVLAAP